MLLQKYDDSANKREIATTVVHDYLDAMSADSGATSSQSGSLKNTAIAALVSLPTIIQPVFDLPLGTTILPESFSHQPTFVPSPHWFEDSAASVVLASVLEGYIIHNTDAVESYLAANSDLLDFLTSVSSKLKEVEDIESIELEHYHDSEEGWDKLFVVANTRLDDMDLLDQLEAELFGSLFEPEMAWLSGRVVLSIG